jgi:hypothetical protein
MNRQSSIVLVICIVILMMGAFATYGNIVEKDASMREDLLVNTKLAATAFNASEIKALTGSPADLNSSNYLKLKTLVTDQKETTSSARFVYLLGQYDNGTVFFFIDSEPADSPDNSPPGQIFSVHSETIDNAFNGTAGTGGPLADPWGVWVSGMVPILDPETGEVIAVLGMDISADNWNHETILSGMVPGLSAVLTTMAIAIFFTLQNRRRKRTAGCPKWHGPSGNQWISTAP